LASCSSTALDALPRPIDRWRPWRWSGCPRPRGAGATVVSAWLARPRSVWRMD
jgi:hypothetical protein